MQPITLANKIYNQLLKYPVTSIIVYAILIRLFILFFYEGYTIVPDSQNYIELGKLLSEFNLDHKGQRTPGFPLLIALANNNLQIVAFFQSILGIISTYLIFDLTRLITKQNSLSLLVAFIATSFLHVLYFEVAIMTETLTLFTLLIIFWLIKKHHILSSNSKSFKILIISFLCAFLYLVRPMFIYIPILLSCFYLVKNWKVNPINTLLKSIIFITLPLISLYSWSALNKKNIGVFGSTYYLGINLSQNATSFFDKAPDDEALIRDIFVKHRDSIIAHNPNKLPMSVWAAYDELLEKTKLSPPELSNKLGEISKKLFINHPLDYFKQVGISWEDFWFDYLVWKPKQITNKHVKNIFMGTWLFIQQYILIFINLLFLWFSVKKIISFLKNNLKTFDFDLLIVATVLLGSLAQAIVTYGSNGRFSFPYFPLIVYFVFSNIFNHKAQLCKTFSNLKMFLFSKEKTLS
jgi:hypothetical protein